MRLHAQQRAVLQALIERSPQSTKELGRVHDGYGLIRDPGRVARRLRGRGLVSSETVHPYGEPGRAVMYWSITDTGLQAMGWTR